MSNKIGALFLGLTLAAAVGGGYYAYTVLSPDPLVVSDSEQGTVITRKSKIEIPETDDISQGEVTQGTESDAEYNDYEKDVPEEDASQVELPYSAGYFADKLTDDEALVCRQIYKGITEHKDKVSIKPGVVNSDDVCELIVMLVTCSPDMDYIDSNYSVEVDAEGYVSAVQITYTRTEEEIEERQEQMERRIEEICAEMTPAWSDFQKFKLIHDTVVRECEYAEDGGNCYSPYGCLVDKKAVCEGYSKAVMMLCDYAQIKCLPVVGEGFNDDGTFQAHLWNKIMLDGSWYNTDVTWDDPVFDSADDYLRYDYFTLTDEEVERNHTLDENRFFDYPECNSNYHDYYKYSGYYAETPDDAFRAFDNAVRDAMIENDDYARIKCSDEECYEQTLNWVYSNGIGSDAIFALIDERAEKLQKDTYDGSSYSVINNAVTYCITLRLNRK